MTYSNLVLDASPADGSGLATSGYSVKTGWGSPHTLDCSFNDNSKVSCLKNKTYTLFLVNTRTEDPDG